jgi:hypothetical protein
MITTTIRITRTTIMMTTTMMIRTTIDGQDHPGIIS